MLLYDSKLKFWGCHVAVSCGGGTSCCGGAVQLGKRQKAAVFITAKNLQIRRQMSAPRLLSTTDRETLHDTPAQKCHIPISMGHWQSARGSQPWPMCPKLRAILRESLLRSEYVHAIPSSHVKGSILVTRIIGSNHSLCRLLAWFLHLTSHLHRFHWERQLSKLQHQSAGLCKRTTCCAVSTLSLLPDHRRSPILPLH
jgi:hypothetical protein